MNLRIKSINKILDSLKNRSLNKTLGAFDLIMLGVGCTIGTGVFVLTGIAAADAGPAISISYLLASIICIFCGLAYAEMAAALPVAGGAYTYTYVTFGEFFAWFVAAGLLLEYAVGASTVAAGWSGYFVGILKTGGISFPEHLSKGPFEGGIVNLPAVLVSMSVGLLLIKGTKESVVLNRILVAVKLLVIATFIFIAAPDIKMENYQDFMPTGWPGIALGAATIFFAFIGFDSVSTAAEEAKNPNKTVPIGIIGSLLICGILYVAVSLVLTGIVHYSTLDNPEPMAHALRETGSKIGSALVGAGVVCGMISVLLVLMFGQSRILFVMSRDKLLPKQLCVLHKKFNTPYISCLTVTLIVMTISGLFPLQTLGHMTSLGTLFAFTFVSLAVMYLRVRSPNLDRPFRCPMVFIVAPLAVLSCGYLIVTLLGETGKMFACWITISVVFYLLYSFRNSPLRNKK